jgi:hypothetical protein
MVFLLYIGRRIASMGEPMMRIFGGFRPGVRPKAAGPDLAIFLEPSFPPFG